MLQASAAVQRLVDERQQLSCELGGAMERNVVDSVVEPADSRLWLKLQRSGYSSRFD
jgi:hypothetical protein